MESKELRQYLGLKAMLNSIDEEIKELYYPVSSPNGTEKVGGNASSHTAGNPTAIAVERVLRLKAERLKVMARIKNIEDFIDGIEDSSTRSIARYHYILGYSWTRTAYKVYGNYNGEVVRNAINRYLKSQKE